MTAHTAINLRADSVAPSLGLMSLEPLRAALEYANMHFTRSTPKRLGDGHPVVIFPGLGTDGRCVGPLRSFCDEAGFAAYEWGKGYNTGPRGDVDVWLDELAEHVDQLVSPSTERISLIGWSLGGIYARELAKILPQRVRQVITIGTPFAGTAKSTNVGLAYRLLNGNSAKLDEAMAQRLSTAPPVPTTSIYSRSDGIVAWEACIQRGGAKHAENIEVDGSHCGLGWNRNVLSIVENRLNQQDGKWKPFQQVS